MGTYEIHVREGRFESAFGAGSSSGDDIKVSDKPLPEGWIRTSRSSTYSTVSNLFKQIEKAEKVSNSRFEVSYHPTLGYPTYLHVDPSSSTFDDELLVRVIELEPLGR